MLCYALFCYTSDVLLLIPFSMIIAIQSMV